MPSPSPLIDKLNAKVRRVIALPEVKDKLRAQGYVLTDGAPAEFNTYIKSEYAKWAKLIQGADIQAE